MDQSFRKNKLMLGSFNPGLSREEIAKKIEPFGPIQNIKTYRRVVNNTMYNLSLVIIQFGSKEGYDMALHSDASQLDLNFVEIDPFFMRPYLAFIFGLPRPGNLATYTKIFQPFGAKDIRIIEKSTSKNDYIIASTFESESAFRNFIKIIDKSYVSGNLIRAFPFNILKENPTYTTSMPNLEEIIGNEENYDFKLLYYEKEYKCWSGSAIASCDAISSAYSKFLTEKGESQIQDCLRAVSRSSSIASLKGKTTDVSEDNEYNDKGDSSDEIVIDNEEEDAKDAKNSDYSNNSGQEEEVAKNDNDDDENSVKKDESDSKSYVSEANSNVPDLVGDSDSVDDMTEFVVPQIPGPFELIVDYINGKTIQLCDTNAPFIMMMSEQLGMPDLYRDSSRFVNECSNIKSNAVMLRELYELNGNLTPLLSIVANKFEEICQSLTVRRFPMELLEMIISSPFFSIRNEDELFEYIRSFKKTDSVKYHYLLKQVKIEKLSSDKLLNIVSDPTIDLNSIREGLMLQMKASRGKSKQNLRGSINSPRQAASLSGAKDDEKSIRYPDPPKNIITRYGDLHTFGSIFCSEFFKKSGDKLFDGIFAHLRSMCNGQNPVKAGIVDVTASTEAHEHPFVILDNNPQVWFGTQDIVNSYIVIDFKTRKVSLVGYSLKTHSHDGNGHLTGWSLKGSNDGTNWTLIDQVPNTDQFNNLGAEGYFPLQSESPFYRLFELKQIRQNTMGYHNFRLSSIEFFGSIQ